MKFSPVGIHIIAIITAYATAILFLALLFSSGIDKRMALILSCFIPFLSGITSGLVWHRLRPSYARLFLYGLYVAAPALCFLLFSLVLYGNPDMEPMAFLFGAIMPLTAITLMYFLAVAGMCITKWYMEWERKVNEPND